MRAIKLLSKSKSRLAPKAPKIKGSINIRNHLKSALNIGTQKLKKKRYAYYNYSFYSYRSSNCIFLFYGFLFINISVDNCSNFDLIYKKYK